MSIDIDDEDLQPPDQPQQSFQPPLTPPTGGLEVPLPDSPGFDTWLSRTNHLMIHRHPLHHQRLVCRPRKVSASLNDIWTTTAATLWWPPVYPGTMPVAGGIHL